MSDYTSFYDGESPAHEAINQRLRELEAALQVKLPPGMIVPYGKSVAPTGWLMCDGSAVSRSTYATLFSLIGATYGPGDGVTTFNVPDLRGRLPVGAGQGASLTNRMLAQTLGEENHQLTVPELASHTHTASPYSGGAASGTAGSARAIPVGSGQTSSSAGSDTPHNNMQPSLVTYFMIKT